MNKPRIVCRLDRRCPYHVERNGAPWHAYAHAMAWAWDLNRQAGGVDTAQPRGKCS